MCLVTKMIAPRRATRDIVCYKVLEKVIMRTPDTSSKKPSFKIDGFAYFTPSFRYQMEMGKQYDISYSFPLDAKKVNKLWQRLQTPYHPKGMYPIGPGFFHALTNKKEAERLNGMFGYTGNMLVSVECIIPAGTLYYISEDKSEICAKSLKLIKIIGNESDQNS